MPGDFSRNSVNPPKKYSGVLMQQGRVQVDADWNEQLALQHHRTFTETRDVIGNCGTPKNGDGFFIDIVPGGGDLRIGRGHFYVHGLLCENDPESVAVSFPAASASSATGPKYRLRRSPYTKPSGPFHVGAHPQWNNPQGQVNVPSLALDDRNLAVGDWVELYDSSGRKPLAATILTISQNIAATDPNSITPNYYTLTLNRPVAVFQNARVVWLRRVVTFTTQPFLHSQLDASLEAAASSPSGEVLQLADGIYLITIEAWQREVDALEDPHIREVALGGPDTAERLQTAWQVHVVPYDSPATPSGPTHLSPPSGPVDCCGDFPGWDQYKASIRTTGLMNAQAPPPGSNVPSCQLPPSAGYLGMANQLYRIEIFRSGDFNDTATFVWSRDNAMVETNIVCVDSTGAVYVNDLGKDDLHSFAQNDWVEIFDRDDELLGNPRFLAQITAPTGSSEVPPCAAPGAGPSFNLTLTPAPTQFSGKSNLRLRRWDMPETGSVAFDSSGAAVGIPITQGWIQVENNIQVNFTDGYYATRSYWQIPARTATGDIEWPPFDIPNTNPIPQPPLGVNHYFCRLATLTVTRGHWALLDCRCQFPSLTHICADDICYHGDGCELQTVDTVQEAIEELGARIRFHNKMLHGWGVVCGLAVTCGEGTTVRVAPGYGIDCEGYDLRLTRGTTVDFASIVELSPGGGGVPDGDYELILEKQPLAVDRARITPVGAAATDEACCSKSAAASTASCVTFRAIACKPEMMSNEILQGTLLLDFYEKCIKRFVAEFQTRYSKSYISPDKQVTEAQALVSSLTDLLFELAQPSLTSDVFISKPEHELLGRFYDWLAGQLHDRTFCAIKDLPSYPAYHVDGAMTTIFGRGFSTRLRIDPTGTRAYGIGADNQIFLYDLSSRQLAAAVPLPSPANGSGWVVQDVAFDRAGGQIYAIATTNGDSLFAIGTLRDFSITWTSTRSLGAISFSTMVSSAAAPTTIFAVAAGRGLYSIALDATGGTGLTQISGVGVPVGHLIASADSLYLTTNSGAAGGNFDQVQRLRFAEIKAGKASPTNYTLPAGTSGNPTDDILVEEGESAALLVTATQSSAGRQVLVYRGAENHVTGTLALNTSTTLRLAYSLSLSAPLITFEDSCLVQKLDLTPGAFKISRYCPAEVHPNSIAVAMVSANQGKAYVLNSTSNTISVIPAGMNAFNDYAGLETYRSRALDAFIQMAGALLQDFKDCLCDLFLVNCPTCETQEEAQGGPGVPLACVTFRNGSVYQICNLEKRRYVKSFPTVGYWLSLIPVIPLVRTLIEKLCCLVLPSIFEKYLAPGTRANYAMNFDPAATRKTVARFQSFRLNDAITALTGAFAPVRSFARDAAFTPFRTPAANLVRLDQLVGQPADAAQRTLQTSNINVVAVIPYDPAQFGKNVVDFATAPASLPPGSTVTLVTDPAGNVKFYIPGTAAETGINAAVQATQQQVAGVAAAGRDLQSQIQTIQQQETPVADNVTTLQKMVSTLQAQVVDLQASSAKALAQRDQQIASLTASAQQMQAKLQTVDDLTAQVKVLASRIPPPGPVKG
jgi:hypothetical protein